MVIRKINIEVLHKILYYYYQKGVELIDMECIEGGNQINIWPSDTEGAEPEPEIKIEDIT